MAKEDLIKELEDITGVEVDPKTTVKELEEKIAEAKSTSVENSGEASSEAPTQSQDKMYSTDDVKNLIAQALKQHSEMQSNNDKDIIRPGAPMKHFRPIRRWRTNDGKWKWVVDLKDFNTDDLDDRPKYSFEKYNEKTRQYESFVGLIFNDGTEEVVHVNRYVDKRDQKYCRLVETENIDKSYATGIVDERIDGKKTGRKVEQRVTIIEKRYKVELPDGTVVTVPDYAIA